MKERWKGNEEREWACPHSSLQESKGRPIKGHLREVYPKDASSHLKLLLIDHWQSDSNSAGDELLS